MRHQGKCRTATSAEVLRARVGPEGGFRYGPVAKPLSPTLSSPPRPPRHLKKKEGARKRGASKKAAAAWPEDQDALPVFWMPVSEVPKGRKHWHCSGRGAALCRLAARRRTGATPRVRAPRPPGPSAFAHCFTSLLPVLTATLVSDQVRVALLVRDALARGSASASADCAKEQETDVPRRQTRNLLADAKIVGLPVRVARNCDPSQPGAASPQDEAPSPGTGELGDGLPCQDHLAAPFPEATGQASSGCAVSGGHLSQNSPDGMYWQSVEELEEEKAARRAAAQDGQRENKKRGCGPWRLTKKRRRQQARWDARNCDPSPPPPPRRHRAKKSCSCDHAQVVQGGAHSQCSDREPALGIPMPLDADAAVTPTPTPTPTAPPEAWASFGTQPPALPVPLGPAVPPVVSFWYRGY